MPFVRWDDDGAMNILEPIAQFVIAPEDIGRSLAERTNPTPGRQIARQEAGIRHGRRGIGSCLRAA